MVSQITVNDFIHTDLKPFSNEDNVRSIPSCKDGFKDAQRKAVFGMSLFGSSSEKVSRLSSKIAVETNYSHGETSLSGTLVGLAQSFPGANNINLLEPIGQFGSRLSSEASSERYISTMKSKWFDKIIRSEDAILLERKLDEGIEIEPRCYYPIVPLWLVNGTNGIGTGYRSLIYPRKLESIARLIKEWDCLSDDDKTALLVPWFIDWKGSVETKELGKYELTGCYEIVNTTTIRITELPISYDVDKYKGILIDLLNKGIIKDFDNNSSEESFDFLVSVKRETTKLEKSKIISLFKLSVSISDVPTLWTPSDELKRYDSVLDAFEDFLIWRRCQFEQWKDKRLALYQHDIKTLQTKADFINEYISLGFQGKKETDVIATSSFDKDTVIQMMSMPVRSLTAEKIDELNKQIAKMNKDMLALTKKTSIDLFNDSVNLLMK